MTIYVFVVDTSPGMAQPLEPAGLGGSPLTCLEIAKSGIEHFYKSLEQQKRIEEGDKFVLASYDTAGSSSCIKVILPALVVPLRSSSN